MKYTYKINQFVYNQIINDLTNLWRASWLSSANSVAD
jgi:hypothetical protein